MSKDDRTEAPTPKKKREARKQGQIARSPELVAWVQVLLASYLLELTVHRAGGSLRELMARSADAIARPDQGTALALLGDGLADALLATLPLAGALMAVGIVGGFAQTGGFVSFALLKPKWDRVDPRKGVQRLLGPQGAWHAAKSVAKVAALAFVTWSPLEALVHSLVASGRVGVGVSSAAVAQAALQIARAAAYVGLLIAGLDYAHQRRKVSKGMKMTKQEVKDEHRQSEGDPHVKGQIRSRQMALGRNRMIAAVSDASVVLVNPTHVAVALRYDPGTGAPRVVAKGRGAIAQRIREEAALHRVPLVRDVALARTLEATVPIGGEIPAELYAAVARVLAFLSQLRHRVAWGGVVEVPRTAQVGP